MRRFKMTLLCAAGAWAASASAAPTSWSISEASAGVTVLHAGIGRPGVRGGHVDIGDTVMTGSNARAVLVHGEQYAVVAPNTRLMIANAAPSGGLMQIFEQLGNVVFSVKKNKAPHFGVSTPYLAAVVKGTTFSVTVDASGASVQVVEGAVEVATNDGGARDLVLPGSIAQVGARDLGQLAIQGHDLKVLRSPNAAPRVEQPRSPAVVAPQASVISAVIEEAPHSFASTSDGLVSGSTQPEVALASIERTTDRPTLSTTPAPLTTTPPTPAPPTPGGTGTVVADTSTAGSGSAIGPSTPITTPTAASGPTGGSGPGPAPAGPPVSPGSIDLPPLGTVVADVLSPVVNGGLGAGPGAGLGDVTGPDDDDDKGGKGKDGKGGDGKGKGKDGKGGDGKGGDGKPKD